jgi:probable rRNA maturation factor
MKKKKMAQINALRDTVEIELQNPYHYQGIPAIEQLNQWANAALQATNNSHNGKHTLVIRIVDQAEGLQLNRDYRMKEKATNILSFPFEAPPLEWGVELEDEGAEILDFSHLGDLVICEPVLRQEAMQQHKSLQQHWAHLLVHGTLHLQGFDHISDADANIMEALEISILGNLGFANPYAAELIQHNPI